MGMAATALDMVTSIHLLDKRRALWTLLGTSERHVVIQQLLIPPVIAKMHPVALARPRGMGLQVASGTCLGQTSWTDEDLVGSVAE
ncbi:hypothetical protein A1F95_10630, partial [Pyrenophora tritici-repentis]